MLNFLFEKKFNVAARRGSSNYMEEDVLITKPDEHNIFCSKIFNEVAYNFNQANVANLN